MVPFQKVHNPFIVYKRFNLPYVPIKNFIAHYVISLPKLCTHVYYILIADFWKKWFQFLVEEELSSIPEVDLLWRSKPIWRLGYLDRLCALFIQLQLWQPSFFLLLWRNVRKIKIAAMIKSIHKIKMLFLAGSCTTKQTITRATSLVLNSTVGEKTTALISPILLTIKPLLPGLLVLLTVTSKLHKRKSNNDLTHNGCHIKIGILLSTSTSTRTSTGARCTSMETRAPTSLSSPRTTTILAAPL